MKLYYNPMSNNSRKVAATIHELGAKVELMTVDFFSPSFDEHAFARLNPNGMIPVLEDGAFKLWESNAIMQYLADRHQSPLLPQEPQARADITRWQFWDACHFHPACGTLSFENLFKKLFNMGEPDTAAVAEALEDFHHYAAVLDQHLSIRKYVTGHSLTLADFTIGASLMYAEPAGIPVGAYANIKRWYAELETAKGWKASTPPARR